MKLASTHRQVYKDPFRCWKKRRTRRWKLKNICAAVAESRASNMLSQLREPVAGDGTRVLKAYRVKRHRKVPSSHAGTVLDGQETARRRQWMRDSCCQEPEQSARAIRQIKCALSHDHRAAHSIYQWCETQVCAPRS